MKVFQGRAAGAPSELRGMPGTTFTGNVWADPVMPKTENNVTVNNVVFTPGARTFWHTHEHGQLLQVTGGCGWVCAEGELPQEVRSGDVVWIPGGERHWHGATDSTYMIHLATSIGKSSWQEEVAEKDYLQRKR